VREPGEGEAVLHQEEESCGVMSGTHKSWTGSVPIALDESARDTTGQRSG